MKFCFHTFLFLVLSFMASSSKAQIINVENSRMQSDTTGWLGKAGAGFSYLKNVQEVLSLNVSAQLQYKTERDLYLILGNYNLLRGNQREFENNFFFHLRYNRKLNSVVRWEVFSQWQQNVVTGIGLRALAGTGPRFKLHDTKKFRFYLGTLAMVEYEKSVKSDIERRDTRGDFYGSFTWQPRETITLTNTTFYQPLLRRWSDYRVLHQLNFEVKATTHLSFVTNWNFLYDAFPPDGTPRSNIAFTNGFTYNF